MHSRNVLRAHFALTQVLLLIIYHLTSNSSLSLVPLNHHLIFAVIFKSNSFGAYQTNLSMRFNSFFIYLMIFWITPLFIDVFP
jgi:hypothetical protein